MRIVVIGLMSFTFQVWAQVWANEELPKMAAFQTLQNRDLGQLRGRGDITLTGTHRGKRLFTGKAESAQILDTPAEWKKVGLTTELIEELFGESRPRKDYLVLSGFAHGRKDASHVKTWTAVLPKSAKVEKLIAQADWFGSGMGGHFQLRILLDQKILLISDNKKVWIPGDIIYSLFGILAEGGATEWGMVEGLTGEFGNSYQFSSNEFLGGEQVKDNFIEQYELKIPTKERGERSQQEIFTHIFHEAAINADQSGQSQLYNLVFNSCITAFLQALHANGKGLINISTDIFNPYSVIDALKAKSYVARELPSLNEELGSKFKSLRTSENAAVLDKINFAAEAGILTGPHFDLVARELALFIIENRLTRKDLSAFLSALKLLKFDGSSENIKKDLEALLHTSLKVAGLRFIDRIEDILNSGKGHDVKLSLEVFELLRPSI